MDGGFLGFARQGSARIFIVSASNPSTGAVEVPDAAPTWRLYGPSGIIIDGTVTPAQAGPITGATNATPIQITSASHGLRTGNVVTVADVLVNTGANGTRMVTKTGVDTFTLDGSVGNGVYGGGGTWKTTGLHAIALSISDTNLLTPGETYTVEMSWTVAAALRKMAFSFGCN